MRGKVFQCQQKIEKKREKGKGKGKEKEEEEIK